ncbi:MAG: putative bifunctional diguanylate cyclase/phosphodiesterase [Gammaproteobacteria bacterium]
MTSELRILILEDVATDAELAERELRKAAIAFTARQVKHKDAFVKALREFAPDIILSDYKLPHFTALDALSIVRELKVDAPFILITGALKEEAAVRCMREGAYDYILKSSLKRLPSAVSNALKKSEAEREKAKAIQSLRKSEERFRLVARATNDAIRDWNMVTNVVWWNAGVRTLFGYPNDEVTRTSNWWFERIHPDHVDRVTAGVLALGDNDAQIWFGEYPYRRADGTYAAVIDRGLISRDVEGRPVRMVSSMMDITELRQAEQRIAHLAYYDALTGLPNRTLFEDRLRQALMLAKRNAQALFVMFLDLDRFKTFNDTLGPAVGDRLLHSVAQRLKSHVRASDTVARFAADGFALLFIQIGRAGDAAEIAGVVEDAVEIARNIIEAFRPPFNFDGQELYVTASIGISLYPHDGADEQALLRNAGAAVRRAKEQGGNNYQFYAADMNDQAIKRLSLGNSLRRGLEREEFLVYYQPLVDINSGRTVGLEALIRWQHPELGLVSPAEFIPLAEETGLIVVLGEWVLRTACAKLKGWQEQATETLRLSVSVNLSPYQFQQSNLVEMVAQALTDTGLDANCLELELTEGSVMKNPERTISTLRELREMGVQIAIDDFGSGYSSLSYLKRFPIDRLKIDQSFVRDTTSDPADAAIIMAIITLAHNLRLKVIAEGVETDEQLRFLRLLKCDEVQGYLFSRPLPADEIGQLLLQMWPLTAMEKRANEARS